jgi:creatinine amidohydrolase/Fe(II)-dependent formamide hydrolase-like protein
MKEMKTKSAVEVRHRDEIDPLVVTDRLEVGPVRLKPDRFSVPYQVTTNEGTFSTELAYKYEEPVFDPEDSEDMNLAGMIGAQLALNYGLFSKAMVFHGEFDRADRAFLLEMAKNTAREIYVKKFLEPNPFLVGEVSRLAPERRKSYLRAELVFPEASEHRSKPWTTSTERHAVLSSGGKDSLLTYGLLREMGREVHPIFLNESGRHWFTALNAYRHFAREVPHTARVWTNSDRVFSWMLRHFPFVRKDFADVRSDEYPIRLWTVAVFLFGALPLLRKGGVGRLLLGDEYDTTERTTFRGITHYNGLYDQSRYFDEAMSNYFRRKGWGVSQFSLLRPMSEILIEKTLASRYPDLLKLQTSCHATHMEDDRVRPCGKCEKCRRIVGMLHAFDRDPKDCGFSEKQIEYCLKSLVEKGVHQELPATRHLGHLLHSQGKIERPFLGSVKAEVHPEVLELRFDRQRSAMNGIPKDLREPLYRILMQHAEGAVKRVGRLWVETDPFEDPEADLPYRFETVGGGGSVAEEKVLAKRFLLAELTWPEAENRFKQTDVALLPVGSIEQHGPHLPLDTDAFDADYLAKQVAASCSDPKPLVLPLIPYGVSYAHDDFSGTVSIGPETMSRLVYEIGMSVAQHGITKLVVINGHGGNEPALHFAAQMINRDAHIFTCVDTGETSDKDIEAMSDVPNDVHAGDIETSTTLAVRPELVKMELAERFVPKFSSRYLDFTSQRGVGWYARTAKITPSGVFGDPTLASRSKGEKMWEVMIRHLVELVEALKSMTLDEIFQRRL